MNGSNQKNSGCINNSSSATSGARFLSKQRNALRDIHVRLAYSFRGAITLLLLLHSGSLIQSALVQESPELILSNKMYQI